MPLFQVIGTIVIVGLIMWLIDRYVPMKEAFKTVLNVVVLIAVVLWLLQVFGVLSMGNIRVGR